MITILITTKEVAQMITTYQIYPTDPTMFSDPEKPRIPTSLNTPRLN